MIFKAYTRNTIINFFKKFNKKDFYIEEAIEGECEIKYYYVKENVYAKNGIIIKDNIKKECTKISKILGLEVFSLDVIEKNKSNVIIDVNPAAGFYLLDDARNKLIYELENIKK